MGNLIGAVVSFLVGIAVFIPGAWLGYTIINWIF